MARTAALRSGLAPTAAVGARALTIACVVVVIGVVVATLWPFELHPLNQVGWLAGRDGIHFHGRGMVYSVAPLVPTRTGAGSGTLTIQIALEADARTRNEVGEVLAFFDGRGNENLVLGQWQTGLSIFTLGAGARPQGSGESVPQSRSREGYYEIGLDDVMLPHRPRLLTITSGSSGTTVHVDQDVGARYRDAVADVLLKVPSRLVIGGSVTGGDQWTGKVYWLAFYDRELSAEELREDQQRLAQGPGSRSASGRAGLLAFYPFDEGAGTRIRDHGGDVPLEMPPTFFALERRILTTPWEEFRRGEVSVTDATANVLGFVPVGFLFTLWGATNRRMTFRGAALTAVGLGLILSVLIELVQVAMPDRASSATDVATNVTGAVLGAAAARWYLGMKGQGARVFPGA